MGAFFFIMFSFLLFYVGSVLTDNNLPEILNGIGLVGFFTGIVLLIISIINFCGWGYTKMTLPAQIAKHQAEYEMYEDFVHNLDFTDNKSIEIYQQIVQFNHQVEKADRYKDKWWAEGLVYNSSYIGINTVQMRVME